MTTLIMPELWARSLATKDTVHLVETSGGNPRRVQMPQGFAWIAVCRAVLHSEETQVDEASLTRCATCADILEETRAHR
ncbi:hypothetical protein [Labedaea rhizosphaerae]|uniref:Uncharacterized protein n=1 Tax=Labedaea rhizosphaerae TaxID=598644 RepID=A0A4R6SGW8_LABRH|nr:hypothetical protein [Labedaea rhizosphaerae]TDQ01272.1 hypothetical protein EV186_1021140 [Labedaea rhizosphaerae]